MGIKAEDRKPFLQVILVLSTLYSRPPPGQLSSLLKYFLPQPQIKLRAARQIYYQRLQPHLYIEGETRQLSYDVLAGDVRSKPFKLAKVQYVKIQRTIFVNSKLYL